MNLIKRINNSGFSRGNTTTSIKHLIVASTKTYI